MECCSMLQGRAGGCRPRKLLGFSYVCYEDENRASLPPPICHSGLSAEMYAGVTRKENHAKTKMVVSLTQASSFVRPVPP
jgi:hypothetical protein